MKALGRIATALNDLVYKSTAPKEPATHKANRTELIYLDAL